MKDKKKGVLLDLDGTLWDSSGAVVKAWNEILEKHGIEPLSDEDMKRVMGLSMNRIADILFPDLDPKKRYALMRECELHENEYIRRHGGTLFEGVPALLEQLSHNYFTAIISNCQKGYIEAFIQYYGLGKYIDATRAYGDLQKEKDENIQDVIKENDLGSAVYVGDIYNDYVCAQKAEVPFILAAYGFGPFDHEPRAESVEEVFAIVQEVLK